MPTVAEGLIAAGCELRGDAEARAGLLGRGDHLLHLREQSGIDRCRIAPRHRRSMQVLAGEAEYRRVEC